MAGWSAIAGTHEFVVPDEEQARALVQALAEHGFPRVTARPASPMPLDFNDNPFVGWHVIAVDEGPYTVDEVGHCGFEAVRRRATEIAEGYDGQPASGTQCDVSMLHLLQVEAPVSLLNPGSRPPVPEVIITQPPPTAVLALTPDCHDEDAEVDLSGLDDIDWAELGHAHGSAEDVPDMIRALVWNADVWEDWKQTEDELFWDCLLHQGACYTATAPALPFITRILTADVLPAPCRHWLYLMFLFAADQGDTHDVRQVVGEQVPTLLARWELEPPAIQYTLACLAAFYSMDQYLAGVDRLADTYEGTKTGVYLRLASTILRHDDELARAIVLEVSQWEGSDVKEDWTARHVLARGVPHAADDVSS